MNTIQSQEHKTQGGTHLTEDFKLLENVEASQEKQNLHKARSRHNNKYFISKAVTDDMVDYVKPTGRKLPVRNCTEVIGDSMVEHNLIQDE